MSYQRKVRKAILKKALCGTAIEAEAYIECRAMQRRTRGRWRHLQGDRGALGLYMEMRFMRFQQLQYAYQERLKKREFTIAPLRMGKTLAMTRRIEQFQKLYPHIKIIKIETEKGDNSFTDTVTWGVKDA